MNKLYSRILASSTAALVVTLVTTGCTTLPMHIHCDNPWGGYCNDDRSRADNGIRAADRTAVGSPAGSLGSPASAPAGGTGAGTPASGGGTGTGGSGGSGGSGGGTGEGSGHDHDHAHEHVDHGEHGHSGKADNNDHGKGWH